MKRLFLILSFFFFYQNIQSQYFAWAKRAGSYAFDLGYGVGTDNAGNVYIAGKYELKGAKFGDVSVGCAGNHDIYIAKYGPSGNFLWVRTAGGTIGDYAHCIAVDGAGNSYISGEFETTSYFGSVALKTSGSNDIFVAKYNTNGTLLWARKLGGGGDDKGHGICISGGNIYVTGYFKGTANFSGTYLTASGSRDIFVAKYTSDGVFQWARKAGGGGDDEGYAISSDPSGNCYVTGYFTGGANFSGVGISAYGSKDIFIAKYNSAGSLVWVKKAGGTAADYGHGIKVDNNYNVFLTGGFRVKSTFGSIQLTAQKGDADVFVARYDQNGNAVWVRKGGGPINDYGRGIALDANSNLYITGNYGLNATFGTTTLSGADSTEIYFASYDPSGNFRWALKVGGQKDKSDPNRFIEMGLSIATDPFGNVIGSGAYRSSSTFGSTTLAPWDHTDVYVTKIVQGSFRETTSKPLVTPADSASFCSGGFVTLHTEQDSATSYTWIKDGTLIPGATQATFKATVPGRYSVMAVNGNDTLISDATKVIVTQKIEAQITSAAKVFCRDSNSVLKASDGEGCLYRWKRNGRFISDATDQTFKPHRSGDYQVKIIQGSCFDWSPVMHVDLKNCNDKDTTTHLLTALNETKDDSILVNIYPNPNNGLFTLELNIAQVNLPANEVKVEVINAIGQVIYMQTVTCTKGYMSHHVELGSSVTGGIYVLRLTMGETIEKNRLMLIK